MDENMESKLSIADLSGVGLTLEFTGDRSCELKLTEMQAAIVIYMLGLSVEGDEVVGYTDSKLEQLYSDAEKKEAEKQEEAK